MSEITNKTIRAEEILLLSVKVISGAINANPEVNVSKVKCYAINFETETGINPEENLIRIIFKVELSGQDESDQLWDLSAQYTVDYAFEITDLSSYTVKNQEGELPLY